MREQQQAVGGFSRSYAYDAGAYGKPTAITTTIDGQSYTLSQAYDAAGRLETLTYPASQAYPSGLEVGYFYNVRGYLEQVTGPGNALYCQVAEQDASGRLLQDWLGDDSLNDTTYAPNSSRLVGQASAIGATALQQFAYTHDAIGNIDSRSDVRQSLAESFTYDGLDRLTQAQVGTNAPTGMSYDLLGNLLSKSDLGSYAYGENGAGLHALTTVTTTTNQTVTYSYDANGNMTGGAGRTLAWTSYNQLSQVTKGSVSYSFQSGTDRQRYKKVRTAGTTQTTHYVGDVFEKITDSGLTTYRHYVKVNGKAVAIVVDQTSGADVTKYLHRDHLGSITTITDSAGAVLERLSYDSHGKRRSVTTWQAGSIVATEIRGFTGHEHLDDVGLIHMNGRVYDPSLGRMLSPDPVTQSPENAQNFNRYAYVMNNPVRFNDPSGYCADSLLDGRCDIRFGSFGVTLLPIIIWSSAIYGELPIAHYTQEDWDRLYAMADEAKNNPTNEKPDDGGVVGESQSQRVSRLLNEVMEDFGHDLPSASITAVDNIPSGILETLLGETVEGEYLGGTNIQIAVGNRSDETIKVAIFHELLHVDEALAVAGGDYARYFVHELAHLQHDPWISAATEQYRDYLFRLTGEFPKPELSTAPWRNEDEENED